MRTTLAIAVTTLREALRDWLLYNLVVFAVLLVVGSITISQLTLGEQFRIIANIGTSATQVFGTLIAVFLGVGLVSKEIERRSLYSLLAKPLSRTEFFFGKFAGLAVTLLVNSAAMALGLALTLWLTGKPLSAHLLQAAYPIYLGLLVSVALAMMLASVTSSGLASVGAVGLVVAGRYTDILRHMPEILPGVSARILTGLYLILPNFRNFDFKGRVAHGDPVLASELAWATAYAVAYATVALCIGLFFFRRRDLP